MSQTIVPTSSLSVKRWKSYANYKDSGVEWLGEIPSYWEVKRLKYVAVEPIKYGANESAQYNDSDSPRFIRITDITENGSLREDTFKSLPIEIAQHYMLKEGDILFARSGATVGKTFMYREKWGRACYAGYLVRLRIKQLVAIPKFISYFTDSSLYQSWLSSVFIQATIQNVSAEKYANLCIAIPPISEQHTIATFLDHHTTRINTLIAKKEQLIELLKEKRTVLISRAVTKGLDPTVPMKDSGVEWLGEIPMQWNLKKLKYCLRSIEQGWSPACDNRKAELDEWGVLKVGCVNGTSFNSEENKALPLTTEPLLDFEIKPGDILISRANTRELLGSAALVSQVRPRLLLCDKLYRLKPATADIDVEYLILLLRSSLARFQFERDATGASNSMQNISQSIILNLIVPLPALRDQQSIVTYVKSETARIDALISRIQDGIKKLKEYSTALISAAVTGKIDVRDVAEESLHGYLGEEP